MTVSSDQLERFWTHNQPGFKFSQVEPGQPSRLPAGERIARTRLARRLERRYGWHLWIEARA